MQWILNPYDKLNGLIRKIGFLKIQMHFPSLAIASTFLFELRESLLTTSFA